MEQIDNEASFCQQGGVTVVLQISGQSLFLDGTLEGHWVRFLIDTGCNKSLLDINTYRSLGIAEQRLTQSSIRLKGANGIDLENYGEVSINVSLGSLVKEVTFIVTPLEGLEALLGLDMMVQFKVAVNPAYGQVTVDGQEVVLRERESMVCACARDTVYVPPMSGKFVNVEVESGCQGPVILEPDKDTSADVLIMSGLYEGEENVKVFVMNDTDEPTCVPSGMLSGHVQDIEENVLSIFENHDCSTKPSNVTHEKPSKEICDSNVIHLTDPNPIKDKFRQPGFNKSQRMQDKDVIIGRVRPWVLNKERPNWKEVLSGTPELRSYWCQFGRMESKDNVLYREAKLPRGEKV